MDKEEMESKEKRIPKNPYWLVRSILLDIVGGTRPRVPLSKKKQYLPTDEGDYHALKSLFYTYCNTFKFKVENISSNITD